MCVCAFAKSYKEANNYITPVSLVVMLASFISFIPNIELTKNMALVPVANLCLLLRDLLVFKFDYLNILLVLFSNIIYAIVWDVQTRQSGLCIQSKDESYFTDEDFINCKVGEWVSRP